jgi:SAM-dependent methyltransferase
MDQQQRIRLQYSRRTGRVSPDRYAVSNNSVFWGIQQIDAVTRAHLMSLGVSPFTDARLFEVGCGSGDNLLRFLRWGFDPGRLAGCELLEDRWTMSRARLPEATSLHLADFVDLDLQQQFDVVYQSTVLSSVMDDDYQRRIADRMWAITRPGGVVLSYDFAFNNPSNPDVRKVPVSRIQDLFPEGTLKQTRLTLAPPVARRLERHRMMFHLLSKVPLLLTHRLVSVTKPVHKTGSPA